ncbi:3-keto-5-aminohexanoate cleavage protein [Tropicimonas sp. S265A]|uniref:3-keto-5-aminohexanoate cleavage protein n=1 Tax=Tropicimonas sp. S265A TaxID=3415134 RepID=UPI003C7AE642
MNSTILEVALNGPWSRDLQPLMPTTVDELIAEGIACARAGASVVHCHVYDPETGRQYENFNAYRAVIEGIRAVADVIVYPTLPLSGSPDAPRPMSPATRFEVMVALAEAGLIEWAVIDPGSTQFTRYDQIAAQTPGFLYRNPEEGLTYGLDKAVEFSIHPSYAIYEPGFLRLGAAQANERPGLPTPIYRFMFSEGFTFGFPPTAYALAAYHHLLSDVAPDAPWMIAGLHVDILPLIPNAIERAGHVRVGLEDAPFGSSQSNAKWVEMATTAIETCGGTLATAADIRANLAP